MNIDLRKLRACDIMRADILWTTADESLRSAAGRMREHRVRALLVRAATPTGLPGILTSKDVVNLLGSQAAAVLDDVLVGDVATATAICVPAHTQVVDCINLMRMAGVRRMPVLDGTQVVGVLSSSDIFDAVLHD